MHFPLHSSLLPGSLFLLVAASLSSSISAGGPCGTPSHCNLPRWVPDTADGHDEVGHTVAFDGDTAAASAPGSDSVYVYERDGALWSQVAVLNDPFGTGNDFGVGLDLEGDVLVVGSPEDGSLVSGAGAVHIFERIGGSWTHTETFLDPTPTMNGHFGYAVSVSLDKDSAGD